MAPRERTTTELEGTASEAGPAGVLESKSKVFSNPELSIFSKFTWWVVVYNLLVVAWGVFLRASKNGDGCGSHWPMCDGDSTPLNGPGARFFEWSHRQSTGVAGLLVVVMLIWAIRKFPKGAMPRIGAWAAFGFMVLEILVGAALVKFNLVTNNASTFRAEVMSFHVVSTFMLIGSMAFAAFAGSPGRDVRLRGQGVVGLALAAGFLMVAFLGVSGAISALGHTLMPVKDVLKAAAEPTTFWMVRLQPLHPWLSVAIGLYIVLLATLVSNLRPDAAVTRSATWLVVAYGFELALGLVNIKLMAPYALQMLHLVAADAIIISMVVFACNALRADVVHQEMDPMGASSTGTRATVREYIWLTKPRIISLLLFTTITALFASAGGWPGAWTLLWVTVGGYMMAGAANAINMVVERDLDLAMARTRERPTITQAIPAPKALGFALILAVSSFALLTAGANLLTAILALAGLVFYVSVYTLALKRRTWLNIVIGGAAGAFPPLVGWAAAQGTLSPLAYYLFAIVFLWTPVHFWALSLIIKDDYAAAGVPMLPLVKGIRFTTHHIAFYTFLTVGITLVPVLLGLVGWSYLVSAVLLNGLLVWLTVRLVKNPSKDEARGLFHFSMLYLALLFLAVAVDRSIAMTAVVTPLASLVLNGSLAWLTVRMIKRPGTVAAKGVLRFSMVYLAILLASVAVDRYVSAPPSGVTPAASVTVPLARQTAQVESSLPAVLAGRGTGFVMFTERELRERTY
jgi:protoheme IX farnesyltransferase